MRTLIPGERFTGKIDSSEIQRLTELSPFVRQSGDDWRTPWIIKERVLLDYLIVYIAGGEGRFSVDGSEFPVKSRDLIWIPPGTLHEMRGTSKLMNCVYIHFDLLYDSERSNWDACIPGGTTDLSEFSSVMHPPLNDPLLSSWKGKIPLSGNSEVMRLMKKICLEQRRNLLKSQLLLRGLMLQLIYELIINRRENREDSIHPYKNKMQDAATDILEAAGSELDIHKLASRYALSESHFRKLFREVHHQTPGEMHRQAKFRLATEKLVYTNKTLAEIADELNYNNVNNFSRAFRKAASVSPGTYRRSKII